MLIGPIIIFVGWLVDSNITEIIGTVYSILSLIGTAIYIARDAERG